MIYAAGDNAAGGNPFAVLTAVVAPAILTNACSVLALGTSNRLARVVDRTRVVARGAGGARAGRPRRFVHWSIARRIATAGAQRLRELGGAAYGVAGEDAAVGEGAASDLWVAGIVCYGGAGVCGGIDCDVLRAAGAVSGDSGAGAAGRGCGGGGIGVGMRVDGA